MQLEENNCNDFSSDDSVQDSRKCCDLRMKFSQCFCFCNCYKLREFSRTRVFSRNFSFLSKSTITTTNPLNIK